MSKKAKQCSVKKTSIGGQAVLEGVMMRGKTSIATAVRDAEGTIRVEAERLKPQTNKFLKIPIIRGAVNFFTSMYSGMKVLMRSAEVFGEDDSEPSKFEKWLAKTFKIDVLSIVMFLGVVLGIAFSVGLFFVIPHVVGKFFHEYISESELLRNLFEGGVRILIFVIYILLTSLLKDIKRTYMYHGAEHKTITCFEKGLDLTVENVRGCRRVHDRCGTTFMFFVMFVSIIIYSIFGAWFNIENGLIKLLVKLALLPLIAGLSYELLKVLSKTSCPLVYPLKAPGLLLQKLTTKEPDDGMIEVAITAFNKALKMDEDETEPTCKFVCPEKLQSITERIKKQFKEGGIEDEADAEWLICSVLSIKRSQLGESKVIPCSQVDKINTLASERLTGKPLWYVLGNCDFYGYEFKVDERALIPRPETEELACEALKVIGENDFVLDLCTGSGAIAITLALKSHATITASDISIDALSLAKENAEKLTANVNFIESDMFENIDGKFNVIISNPPYIPSGDIASLQREVKDFEPNIALDGGEDGIDFYRIIAKNVGDHLYENGTVLLEVGIDEAKAVAELFEEQNYFIEIIKDLSGIDRIVKAVKKND